MIAEGIMFFIIDLDSYLQSFKTIIYLKMNT